MTFRAPALLSLTACVVLLSACPGEDGDEQGGETSDSQTSDTTETETEGTTGLETESASTSESDSTTENEGECYDVSDQLQLPETINCGSPLPCPEVEYNTLPDCEPVTYDPAAAECVINGLANREAGTYRIRDCPGGISSKSVTLEVLPDQTVIYTRREFQDAPAGARQTWRALPSADALLACTLDTPEQLLDCVGQILDEECQLGTPSCP